MCAHFFRRFSRVDLLCVCVKFISISREHFGLGFQIVYTNIFRSGTARENEWRKRNREKKEEILTTDEKNLLLHAERIERNCRENQSSEYADTTVVCVCVCVVYVIM